MCDHVVRQKITLSTGSHVRARSLLCLWAVRELGMSMAAIARRLNLSTVAVSKSVARGAEIAKKEGLVLN